ADLSVWQASFATTYPATAAATTAPLEVSSAGALAASLLSSEEMIEAPSGPTPFRLTTLGLPTLLHAAIRQPAASRIGHIAQGSQPALLLARHDAALRNWRHDEAPFDDAGEIPAIASLATTLDDAMDSLDFKRFSCELGDEGAS